MIIRFSLSILFTAGTAYVLTEDIWRGGAFTNEHLLTILALLAAIGAGHLARQQPILWAIFAAATIVVLIQAANRYSATYAAKLAGIETRNATRLQADQALSEARAKLKAAEEARDAECATGPGQRCAGKRSIALDYESQVATRLADRSSLGSMERSHSGTSAVLAELTGAPADRIERTIGLVLPFLMVLVTELAAIAFLSYQPKKQHIQPSAPTPPAPNPEQPPQEADFVSALRALSEGGQIAGSQRELARRMGMNPTAFNRALAAAKMARQLDVDTTNNRTTITLSQ